MKKRVNNITAKIYSLAFIGHHNFFLDKEDKIIHVVSISFIRAGHASSYAHQKHIFVLLENCL